MSGPNRPNEPVHNGVMNGANGDTHGANGVNGAPTKPPGFEDVLGDYEVLLKDKTCGEPIAMGFKLTTKLSEERFKDLQRVGEVACLAAPREEDGVIKSTWAFVTWRLSQDEAAKLYGPVTRTETGPRGGWKSTTFGKTTFSSRHMKP